MSNLQKEIEGYLACPRCEKLCLSGTTDEKNNDWFYCSKCDKAFVIDEEGALMDSNEKYIRI